MLTASKYLSVIIIVLSRHNPTADSPNNNGHVDQALNRHTIIYLFVVPSESTGALYSNSASKSSGQALDNKLNEERLTTSIEGSVAVCVQLNE